MMLMTQIKQASTIYFPLNSLSTEYNTIYTPMPSMSKETSNMTCIDHERAKNTLLQAILRKKALLRVKIRRQMQRKLLRLWNVCTKNQDPQAPLESKEVRAKKNLDLWKHIEVCCDIDCKEKFCQRSRRIILPLSKCCKALNNQRSISSLCAPAKNHIAPRSRADSRLRKKHDSEMIQIVGETKGIDGTLIYDLGKNKAFTTSYKLEQISGVAQITHTTAGCIERNISPHKDHCTLSHYQESVEGEADGYLVVQSCLQQPQPVEHTQPPCTEDQAIDVESSNPKTSLENLQVEIPLSDTGLTSERKCLSEEERKERKERSDVLIALLSLNKRT